jgi:hypothetical protein
MIRGFAAYLRERFRPLVFVPAILGATAMAVSIPDSARTISTVARALVLMSLLFLQFRVWDDLEDRGRDAQTHPERVIVRAAPGPFWWALVALAVINVRVVQSMGTPASGVWLVALDVAALVAYRWLRGAVSERAWTHWIVLAKYPAFLAIVALATGRPVAWRQLLFGCGLTFAMAQLYEREHNRALKSGDSQ